MGFADYFSRNPNRIATPPSEEDTHFVINQINDFKFTLIKNTLRSNQSNANKRPNNYDVMNRFQCKKTNTHAFCHSRHRNQSPHLNTLNFKTNESNSVQSQINSTNSRYKSLSNFTKNSTNGHNPNQFINVITRNRPQIETSNRTIVGRYRGPNKKKTNLQTMENQPTRPPLVTISTQTEDNDNIGKGREPIQPDLHAQNFPLRSNSERMPDYRKQLASKSRRGRVPGGGD